MRQPQQLDNDNTNPLARFCLRIVLFACSMFIFLGCHFIVLAGSQHSCSRGAAQAVPASNEALFQGRVFTTSAMGSLCDCY